MTKYSRLASTLYFIDFEWPGTIRMDANRASDGVMLRYYYEEETGAQAPDPGSDCSMLEMLVGFAERIDDIMGEPGEQHYDRWFHEMLRNSELDAEMDCEYNRNEVIQIALNIMRRNIGYDGTGGLFPLNRPFEDQRCLSLWDQMSCYMNEKY